MNYSDTKNIQTETQKVKIFSNHFDVMKLFYTFELNVDPTLSC